MAKVKKNLILNELSGKIGNVIIRQVGGKNVVQAAPVRQAPPTTGELQNRQHFREAQAFAQRAKQDAVLWAAYTAEAKRRGGTSNAHAVAISDYRTGPVLHALALQTDTQTGLKTLLIQASDNVAVARVEVSLLQPNGKTITTRSAFQETNTDKWFYPIAALGQNGTVKVTVFDLAGNSTSGNLEI